MMKSPGTKEGGDSTERAPAADQPAPAVPAAPVGPSLKDLPVYNIVDWMPGKTLKEDRDAMVVGIFGTLNDNNLGVMYKGGATLLSIAQYLYKSRQHGRTSGAGTELPAQPTQPAANEVAKTIENSGLQGPIAEALQARFIVQNADRLVQFKDQIEKECRGMADLLTIDFNPLFDEQ